MTRGVDGKLASTHDGLITSSDDGIMVEFGSVDEKIALLKW